MDMSTYERNANRLTVFLLLVEIGLAIAGTIKLSGPIPIHFKGNGEPNRWGNPSTLLVIAFVGCCLVGLLWIIRRPSAELMNIPGSPASENSADQQQTTDQLLATIRVIVAGLFLGVISQILWVSVYHQKQIILWPSFLFIALILASTLFGLISALRLSADR
jgi:hypothetical protein